METVFDIIVTPFILFLGILWAVLGAVVHLIWSPIEFLIIFWGGGE